jgi:ABC-type Zn uptake system ZnuABC Zn-binding protein ZnuA
MIGPNLRRVAGFAIIALAVAACQRAPADQSQVLVVVSLYPLYDFARHIAGDRARVTLRVSSSTTEPG